MNLNFLTGEVSGLWKGQFTFYCLQLAEGKKKADASTEELREGELVQVTVIGCNCFNKVLDK